MDVDTGENRSALLAAPASRSADRFRLERTVLLASLGVFCLGYNTGIIAGDMTYIQQDSEWHPRFGKLSSSIQGMIVSLALAGATVGALCSSISDMAGRRRSMLLMALLYVLGPLIMTLAPNVWVLISGRAVVGLSIGLASCLVNLYISEIVPAESRGRLGSWAPFMGTCGILVSYITSTCLGFLPGGVWRIQLGLAIAPAACLLIFSGLLPETPRWLLSKGRRADARLALQLFYPVSANELVDAELEKIAAELNSLQANPKIGLCSLLCKHSAASLIGIAINVLQQVSGINVVIYFGPTILNEAGFSETAAMVATASVSIVQLMATVLLMRFVDRVGRRPLALSGLVLMMVGLGLLVAAFFLQGHPGAAVLAVAGMLVYRAAFSLSLGPLPYIMTAEFFPQEARASGVALCWGANWGTNVVVSQSFPMMVDFFKEHVAPDTGIALIFGIYMVFCVIALVVVYILLPETRGVSLEAAAVRGSARAAQVVATDEDAGKAPAAPDET